MVEVASSKCVSSTQPPTQCRRVNESVQQRGRRHARLLILAACNGADDHERLPARSDSFRYGTVRRMV